MNSCSFPTVAMVVAVALGVLPPGCINDDGSTDTDGFVIQNLAITFGPWDPATNTAGDFLFLALFLAAALRHSMAAVKTVWAVFAVMLIAPVAFYIWPQSYGIPGLPFLAAAVIWANWRHLRFTREEIRALVFAGALVAVAALGLWTVLRR